MLGIPEQQEYRNLKDLWKTWKTQKQRQHLFLLHQLHNQHQTTPILSSYHKLILITHPVKDTITDHFDTALVSVKYRESQKMVQEFIILSVSKICLRHLCIALLLWALSYILNNHKGFQTYKQHISCAFFCADVIKHIFFKDFIALLATAMYW